MTSKPKAAFVDFATIGPGVRTEDLDALLDVDYYPCSSGDEIPGRIADCEFVIVNKAPVGDDAIAGAKRLRLIALTATGTDNVDLDAARRHGVAVANARGYCSTSVVQHVFALVLGLTQHIGSYDALARSGGWSRSRSFALFDYPIRELAGLALGIVGYGALGRSVGELGESLGMRVLVSARPKAPPPAPSGRVPFEQILEQADVLSLHCPLTAETRHLIGARELAQMKPDALLINTARGGLVDNAALAEALRGGRIGGAGIDVLPDEPPPAGHPLLDSSIPNLLVTPHVAWAAREARQRALTQVTENIAAFLGGRDLRRVV